VGEQHSRVSGRLLASDRFLIVNGDTLADVDLRAMAAQHIDSNALITMAVVDGRPEYNGVVADANGIVTGFGREPGAFHFIGVQMVNTSVFAGVDPDAKSETVHGIYPRVIAGRHGAVRIFHTRTEFFDIGDCTIAADAQLIDTVVWDRVLVGAGTRLSECVVADDVIVAPGSEFSRCSLVMRDNALVVQPFNSSMVQPFG
jgi:NDP-sugar pyrophosphorylase family protein